jgi:hypothetical protein
LRKPFLTKHRRRGEIRKLLGLPKPRATLPLQVKPILREANGDAHFALALLDTHDLSLALETHRTPRVRIFQH